MHGVRLANAIHLSGWTGEEVSITDFDEARYLTELVPLAAIAIGYAIAHSGRQIQAASMIVIAALGIGVAVRRIHGNGEPDLAKLGALVRSRAQNRTMLTNSAVVAYYLRDLHPHLDRPFGLGRGKEASCAKPCKDAWLIVDDARVANSPRRGPGRTTSFGPIYVRVTP